MPRLSKIGAAALAAFGWTGLQSVDVSYLVVAGGGAGGGAGGYVGGGGGAGGYQTGTASLNPTLSYTVTIGAGGSGATTALGASGSNSQFGTLTASVGGGGGGATSGTNGANGGSGGGAGYSGGTFGTGTAGQGNNGANGDGTNFGTGGGGGGASAAGTAGSGTTGGAGGAGSASSISGTSVTYAGGGAGAAGAGGTGGTGGTGGGGNGANGSVNASTAGTANTGGGGGAANASFTTSGSGGSGIVIISYTSATQLFGGGTVTQSGGNFIHTFTTSGTLVPVTPLTASALVVAGGGGGGRLRGGGGGAGGFRTGSSLTIDTNSTYLVTVGAGGAGSTVTTATGTSGGNSVFSSITSTGGGGGGTASGTTNTAVMNGATGGSGGGGATDAQTGTVAGLGGAGNTPSTSPSQGNNGGASSATSAFGGGGGGGAGAVGSAGLTNAGGAGGAGTASSISGSSVTYAGGGGGGISAAGGAGGAGGTGGGGAGASGSSAGSPGTANTGGGGGGDGNPGTNGGAGGSGIVIISYPGSTQQMAGGTVTITGGNVIHTFTSSGYLTPIKYVNNSLRFRSSANANLTRTPASASNRKTWTWSAWVKRGLLTSGEQVLFSAGSSYTAQTYFTFYIGSDNKLITSTGSAEIWRTTQVFRDPAAWYHIVLVVDTTQATADNRTRLYVNGTEVTSFTRGTNLSLNTDYGINYNIIHYIGRDFFQPIYFDGYLTEVNFIDGQALTPNSFGTINSYGVWQPITYGGSYGTNGFYLPFSNQSVSASYLVVAGGGGGGKHQGGGGGAGGLLTGTTSLSSNLSYAITVGAGGNGTSTGNTSGTNGTNSVFNSITATGGGGGSYYNSGAGLNGGSGGGAGGHPSVAQNGGTGVSGQGFNGGKGNSTAQGGGGGGGGASAVGVDGVTTVGGAGGAGAASSISGSSVTYAGGGGGGGVTPGAAGAGGGGAGTKSGTAGSGTANTGGGGGGEGDNAGTSGGGGSGVVIVSYAGVQRFTGGTITTSGGNTIHTFTSSSTLVGYLAGDYSPNGNNWTQNNISTTLGVTYDSMTDVPTLTSATAANYCVLNPLLPASNTSFSNGNLQFAVTTASWRPSIGTIGNASGKFYFEATVLTTTNAGLLMIGAANSSLSLTGNLGSDANGWSWQPYSTSYKYNNNVAIAVGGAITVAIGDVLQCAYDLDNGRIWFGRNNTWAEGTPSAGTGASYTNLSGTIFPAISILGNAGGTADTLATNFGQRPFSFSPPSGYVALNTYNL